MTRIHEGMGAEIIRNMETVLKRPDQELLCVRYDTQAEAINAFYADKEKTVFMYWYKLQEEVKKPKTDTARLVTIPAAKVQPIEFLNFLTHDKAPAFIMTKYTERLKRILEPVMTPDLAVKLAEAGIQFERPATPGNEE
jgi:hypothetical protein